MLTATGREFDLALPNPAAVMADDLAHALAQINRFTGHARRPYSVAEHSLLVLDITERLLTQDIHARLAALMHDAHEAYAGDVSTPAKALIGQPYGVLERRMELTVRSAFGLHAAATHWRSVVKQADLIALATEREQLLPRSPSPWEVLVHVQPATWVDLMAPERVAMGWADWRDRWRDALDALEFARNEILHPVTEGNREA